MYWLKFGFDLGACILFDERMVIIRLGVHFDRDSNVRSQLSTVRHQEFSFPRQSGALDCLGKVNSIPIGTDPSTVRSQLSTVCHQEFSFPRQSY